MTQMPITICGNLTTDPEFRRFDNSGAQLCKLRVATSRRYPTGETDDKNKPIWQDTDNLYIDVECWGQLAVNAKASLCKGFPVVVTGYLVTDVWDREVADPTGEASGGTRYHYKIKAGKVAFELSNFQVSSVRTTAAGNTLEGQQPVRPKTAEDFADASAEQRLSAEDGALAGSNTAAHGRAGAQEEAAPF
ncbi:single-stranded DNA-binding protein [Corynebacterium timonense]|uniref:Single-stranded DNA-binding protein n=1 Tax=Corynebacterium timonense TaxID=441500 RepID=A0A1H1LKH1_9CORY|nr:single-stranded DNA-binding protein [Corynebacterium timonense]SDR74937.1 single-strand DNA-binding protein [Corynebacterium timonense]